LTVAEVLIACSILIILSVIFVAAIGQARSSSEGGMKKLEIRAVHRESQKRLALLFRRAIAPNHVDPAIVSPEYGQASAEVLFHAPSDLIDPTQAFNARSPDYPEYSLRGNPSGGELILQRSDGTGEKQRIGDNFTEIEFRREGKHSLEIRLASETEVRGATGKKKLIQETSKSLVRLPGVR
jgi:hypothetical protein